MKTRAESIDFFLRSEQIWPLSWKSGTNSGCFAGALREVLGRLSDDIYKTVIKQTLFILQLDHIALNIAHDKKDKHLIMVFDRVWEFNHTVVVGILVHEIAHSFGSKTNEILADNLARKWGFSDEIDAMRKAIQL